MLYTSKFFERHLDLEDFLPDSKSLLLDYLCKLCGGVLYDAMFDGCGHMFCAKCLKKAIEMKQSCPISCNNLIFSNIPTSFLCKIIEKRDMFCKNRKNDCDWKGKYSLYEDHIKNECKRQIVKCSNDVCEQKILREDLENHLKVCEFRLVACINCELFVSNILLTCHTNLCPKVNLSCPLSCGITIERKDLEEHAKLFCDNATIHCTYYNYGCEYKGPKKSLYQHSLNAIGEHSLLIIKFLDGFNRNYNERIALLESNVTMIQKDDITTEQRNEYDSEEDDDTNKSSLKMKRIRNEEQAVKEEQESEIKEKYEKGVGYDGFIEDHSKLKEKSRSETIGLWDFNKVFSSSALMIDKNKVTCLSSGKNQHMFAFVSTEINYKDCSWKVNISKYSIWIGLGVCDRSRIINNKYIFTNPLNPTFNHGCFILSSNFYLWNANNPNENNKAMKKGRLEQGEVITLNYDYLNNELSFSFSENNYKLTNVKSNNALVPCVILLSNGDEISLEL